MAFLLLPLFFLTLIVLGIFSYGFNDPNLVLSANQTVVRIQEPLIRFVYGQRPFAAALCLAILIVLFFCYVLFFTHQEKIFPSWKKLLTVLFLSTAVLVLSYPALTYDLFNYMTTAKVAYQYRENPYIVMPIEISNEPYLAFTRAANKVALYGPVWLFLTGIPYVLGGGHIWRTIIAFKLMNAATYLGFSYCIYRATKNLKNVLFFAANPLILLEVLGNGHNDIFMMILALGGLWLWQKSGLRNKVAGLLGLFLSFWVKGATVILTPLLFFRKISWERTLEIAYWLLATVFFIFAPLREELYPWYAVWLVMTASLLTLKSHKYLIWFTIVLSFALELRNLPYIWMGYYEGPGPALRFWFTVIPIAAYVGWAGYRYFVKRKI